MCTYKLTFSYQRISLVIFFLIFLCQVVIALYFAINQKVNEPFCLVISNEEGFPCDLAKSTNSYPLIQTENELH